MSVGNPKRRQISLSLTPAEGEALERAAARTAHSPTSFATALYRYGFRKYHDAGSLQQLLEDVITEGKVPPAVELDLIEMVRERGAAKSPKKK